MEHPDHRRRGARPGAFTELERSIEDVSRRMLTLRNLRSDGLLRRTVYPTVPPKVEYELTDTGRELHRSPLSLLEPVVEVTVTVPEDTVGAVLGDLAARRGRVTGSVTRAGASVVTATVPLAELFGYATRLRSRTQGRGAFTARPGPPATHRRRRR